MPSRTGRIAGALIAGLSVTLAAACSQPAEQDGGGEGKSGLPSSLSIATGTTGGTYYPVGGAMAELIGQHVEGTNASAESTGASVENVRLLESGESDLALIQGDVGYQAVNAEGDFSDGAVNVQTLMVLYPNVYHAVSLQSIHDELGLDCFRDVEGHTFSVGAPGSGNEVATNLVFEALGLTPGEDFERQRYAYTETARALREGQIDAGSWVVGEGNSTLLELESTDPIHLIEICPDERKAVIEQYPFYTEHTISQDIYSTVNEDVETIALWNLLAVSSEMSEEAGYQLAKAMYENVDMVAQVYEPGAEYLTLDTLQNSPVPLHPGLIRYAEEEGVEIPDELRP